MNCFDGCKHADVNTGNKPVTCNYMGEPMVVNKPYFECKYYESESEDIVDVLSKLQK